jgi:hypothetical protein
VLWQDTDVSEVHVASIISMDLWNFGALSLHYMASQPRRPRCESSPPWDIQTSDWAMLFRIMANFCCFFEEHIRRQLRRSRNYSCRLWSGSNIRYDICVLIYEALGYKLGDRGSRVRFSVEDGNFSLHHRVQNGSEAHPASYPMGTRGSFPGTKATGAWRSPPTFSWSHTSTLNTSSWRGA